MKNQFKSIFFAITTMLVVSACTNRESNPYSVKTQNNQEYFEMPIKRHINVDEVGRVIDNDSNEQVQNIIEG